MVLKILKPQILCWIWIECRRLGYNPKIECINQMEMNKEREIATILGAKVLQKTYFLENVFGVLAFFLRKVH